MRELMLAATRYFTGFIRAMDMYSLNIAAMLKRSLCEAFLSSGSERTADPASPILRQ